MPTNARLNNMTAISMRIVSTPKVHSFVLVRMDFWGMGESVLVSLDYRITLFTQGKKNLFFRINCKVKENKTKDVGASTIVQS